MSCQTALEDYKTQSKIQSDRISDEIQAVSESFRMKKADEYNHLYEYDSPDGTGIDSKTNIQCIADKVKEFKKNRKFYQLVQAIDDVLGKIEDHLNNFPNIILEIELLSTIREALNDYVKSSRIILDVFEEYPQMINFSQYTSKRKMEEWAILLEKFGKEFEPNIPFFSYEVFNALTYLCKLIISETEKNGQSIEATKDKGQILVKKEEYNRRLFYVATYILGLIQKEEIATAKEDQENVEIAKMLGAKPYQFQEQG